MSVRGIRQAGSLRAEEMVPASSDSIQSTAFSMIVQSDFSVFFVLGLSL